MTTLFKVGDRVRILRKVRSHVRGWGNSWIPEMDKAVGKIGTVTCVSHVNAHDADVQVPNVPGLWGYPDFALKLVVKTKKKVKK